MPLENNSQVSVVLTQPAGTAVLASVHSVCTRPGWRCRWYPCWLIESSHCSPALGSEAVCSRMGWSGRPWGGLEKKVPHSFQPEGDRGHCEVRKNEILIIRVCLSASLNV